MSYSVPAEIYLLKGNKKNNTRARSEICSQLTIKTLERCQGRHLVSYSEFPTPYSRVSYSECPTSNKSVLLRIVTTPNPAPTQVGAAARSQRSCKPK